MHKRSVHVGLLYVIAPVVKSYGKHALLECRKRSELGLYEPHIPGVSDSIKVTKGRKPRRRIYYQKKVSRDGLRQKRFMQMPRSRYV